MNYRVDALLAFSFAMLGGLVLALSITAGPARIAHDALGPYAVPGALGFLLLVAGCVQAWRSAAFARAHGPIGVGEGKEDEVGYPVSVVRGLGFALAAILYPGLLAVAGYILVTPIFVIAGLWSLAYRRPLPLVITALVFTVVMYGLFEQLLNVPLPTGILFR